MRKKGSGWYGEPRRHSLARRGISTASPGYRYGRALKSGYLPSAGVRDFLGGLWDKTKDAIHRFQSKRIDKDIEREKERLRKKKLEEAVSPLFAPAPVKRVPEEEEIGKAVLTEKEKAVLKERGGEVISPETVEAEMATEESKAISEPKVMKGDPEYGDITREDVTGQYKTVDVDAIKDLVSNREELIELKNVLKKNARIVGVQVKTMRESYELEEKIKKREILGERDRRYRDLKNYAGRVGYSIWRSNLRPQDYNVLDRKNDLSNWFEREKVRYRDYRRQHFVDVTSLEERGKDMMRVVDDLDVKLKELEG